MNFFEPIQSKAPWLEESTAVLAYSGSRAYNTYIGEAGSDIDVRGVFIPPYDMLVNPFQPPEQYGYHIEHVDFVIFDIRKFLRLATKGNPNVVELLWTEPNWWIHGDPIWEEICLKRSLFITQNLVHTYIKCSMNEVKTLRNSMKESSPARKKLVEAYGFDTKAAYHALRFSRMAYEICTQEKLQVKREDAEDLVNVRFGKRHLGAILEEIRDNLVKARELVSSALPEKPDLIQVSYLCEKAVSGFLTRD